MIIVIIKDIKIKNDSSSDKVNKTINKLVMLKKYQKINKKQIIRIIYFFKL